MIFLKKISDKARQWTLALHCSDATWTLESEL
jgi:hypothetical protein